MANNFDSTLVNTILTETALTKVQEKLAWLHAFTTDFSDDVRDERSRSIVVPFASGASSVQTNPTSFETGTSDLSACAITLNHYSKSFNMTSHDLGKGRRLEQLAGYNMQVVTDKIEAVVFTLMNESNFTVATGLSTLSTGATAANMKTAFGQVVGNTKNAILKDTVYAGLLPSDTNGFSIRTDKSGFGFDYIDYTGGGFDNPAGNVVGLIGSPGALVMASAIPDYTAPVNDLLDQSIVNVPELGIAIQANVWGSAASRNVWASYDVLFGAAVGDASAGKLLCGTV